MTRKRKCVECQYCETRTDEKGKTFQYCSKCRHGLPANVTSLPACGDFEKPRDTEHWGP